MENMGNVKNEKTTFNIYMPVDMKQALFDYCEDNKKVPGKIVRKLITDYLKEVGKYEGMAKKYYICTKR
jgi:hypothetical protein